MGVGWAGEDAGSERVLNDGEGTAGVLPGQLMTRGPPMDTDSPASAGISRFPSGATLVLPMLAQVAVAKAEQNGLRPIRQRLQ
ncbi:MAG: hypothetical protein QOF33_3447 [Thermomicrobiales bacterium]|jgi:hypothetical protein|nr:hypothetical protein [Thermomicrobiales bacterium]